MTTAKFLCSEGHRASDRWHPLHRRKVYRFTTYNSICRRQYSKLYLLKPWPCRNTGAICDKCLVYVLQLRRPAQRPGRAGVCGGHPDLAFLICCLVILEQVLTSKRGCRPVWDGTLSVWMRAMFTRA